MALRPCELDPTYSGWVVLMPEETKLVVEDTD